MSHHYFYHYAGTTVQIHLEQPKISQGSVQSSTPLLTFGSLCLILQDPAGRAVTQHDPSAPAASSARGGQRQQDGSWRWKDNHGWDGMQSRFRASVMECLCLGERWIARQWLPPGAPSPLTAAIWGLISILFTSNPDIKWQSFLSLSLSFPLYHPLPGM